MINHLSIIIPTLNEEKYLPRLLDSIVNQKFFGRLEVIVVDGSSEDATTSVARKYSKRLDLRVLYAERGVSKQRNVGASAAAHATLLFIDADVVLSPGLLNSLCHRVNNQGPFVCQVTHLSTEKLNIADLLFLIFVHGLLVVAWIGRSPALNGDFVFTNKQTFKMVGGFAEGALLGEDTHFGLSAYKKGARYRFYPSLKIKVSPRRIRKMGRVRLLLIWARGFMFVRKNKRAIYPEDGFEYQFGQH